MSPRVVAPAVFCGPDDVIVSGVMSVTILWREGRPHVGAAVRGDGGEVVARFPEIDLSGCSSVTFAGVDVFVWVHGRPAGESPEGGCEMAEKKQPDDGTRELLAAGVPQDQHEEARQLRPLAQARGLEWAELVQIARQYGPTGLAIARRVLQALKGGKQPPEGQDESRV